MKKMFVGFSRDHSVSMRPIAAAACKDYNSTIASLKLSTESSGDSDVSVSVINCGAGTGVPSSYGRLSYDVGIIHDNVPLDRLQELKSYDASGYSTPLRDSIVATIKTLQAAEQREPAGVDATFIVLVTTDGQENSSHTSANELAKMIQTLSATGRWTFIARVPRGGVSAASRLGIPVGNILEWDTTNAGQVQATATTTTALSSFISSGAKSTSTFFANLEDVSIEEVQASLEDISDQVEWLLVQPGEEGQQIRDFVESKRGEPMLKGAAHYALVKVEPKVQDSKRIIIRDKNTGAVYAGDAARQMLALPRVGTVRLRPDELGDFEVYIQSTSVNRKVDAGTRILYWPGVGVKFKEGKSAQ